MGEEIGECYKGGEVKKYKEFNYPEKVNRYRKFIDNWADELTERFWDFPEVLAESRDMCFKTFQLWIGQVIEDLLFRLIKCENCKFKIEKPIYCLCEEVLESFCSLMEDKKIPVTSIDGRSVWILNHSNFGCIHFKPREENNGKGK